MVNLKHVKAEMYSLMVDGILQASDVVDFARENKQSAIREAFDQLQLFNDKIAADHARLSFARGLIQRVRVRLVQAGEKAKPLRIFVNLAEERKTEGQGYRDRHEVLSDTERNAMFRRDFGRDMESLILRYNDILSYGQKKALREIVTEVIEAIMA